MITQGKIKPLVTKISRIEEKQRKEGIGTISVVDKNDDLNILHIGYCIGSKWWHKGITSEAFSAIIPYLFNEVGANRIEAQHDPKHAWRTLMFKR